MPEHSEYAVFCGLDVGKEAHHAVALDRAGDRVFDKALPQDEQRLLALFGTLLERGPVLVVVDQPATIGALPVAVARAAGADVAYLPGLAMRRIADLHPGTAKTDARDAYVIAEAARTMPRTLRRVDLADETLAELTVLVGYDDDLAAEATRLANRIRGLLTQVHPALERVLGPRVQTRAVLELLSRFGGPHGLTAAGRRRLASVARKNAPRVGDQLVEDIMTALGEQTVVVPGTRAADTVLPPPADSLAAVLAQRKKIEEQVESILDDHPLALVLTPGRARAARSPVRACTGCRSPPPPRTGPTSSDAPTLPPAWCTGSTPTPQACPPDRSARTPACGAPSPAETAPPCTPSHLEDRRMTDHHDPSRTAEHARLAQAPGRAEADLFTANPWYEWGPYLSERAWGTVREDYSPDGDAWNYFPHDHARSRAYRRNEDGMAGISDIRHELCWPWPCGTARNRSSRSACSGSPARKETTARTPRSTTSTSTRRPRTRT